MAQFIEFITNHLVLAGCWLITLLAIVVYHRRIGGQAVGSQQAVMMINRQDALVLDIRDKKEFETGHVTQAINMPLINLNKRMVELKKHQDKPIVVVCKMGQQSGEAVRTLKDNGYQQVYKLAGGIAEWKAQSLPLVQK
ncbi:MAG: rhodanese-like domain-containing protein [Pseudohongiellaceae bacterium]